MFKQKNPEVLVVGAGPVGLFAALALVKRGIRVQIVDTGIWPCKHSYALALHPQTLRLLDEFGLQDRILEASTEVRSIGLYDYENRRAELRLGGGDSPGLAIFPQELLESLLERALEKAGVHVQWKHEVSRLAPGDSAVGVTIDRYEKESRGYSVAHTEWVVAKSTDLEVPFVIGADGYNSRVRRTLGFEYPQVGKAENYLVFEFRTNMDLGNEARIVLGSQTADVVWPLPGGACRWSFQLPSFSQAALPAAEMDLPTERLKDRRLVSQWQPVPELEDSYLRAFLKDRAPWFTGNVGEITWRTAMHFERRFAGSFGAGRLWLAGDSAHITGPIGGQSMNSGFSEAYELAGILAGILRDGGSNDRLQTHNRRWSAEWRRLHGLEGEICAESGADPWVREHSQQLLACLPAHGEELRNVAGQLKLGFTGSNG